MIALPISKCDELEKMQDKSLVELLKKISLILIYKIQFSKVRNDIVYEDFSEEEKVVELLIKQSSALIEVELRLMENTMRLKKNEIELIVTVVEYISSRVKILKKIYRKRY